LPQPKWRLNDIREQVGVIDGKSAPSIVITNATYLHSIFKKWMNGNIWIKGDRIIYVGAEMPTNLEGTEIVDVEGKKVVPGYIEPHVHPFQLYNPVTFADFSAQTGTTTFISDNAQFMMLKDTKEAFQLLKEMSDLPFSFYWWARFDSQTEREDERVLYSNEKVLEWLQHPDVLLGGELTGWPRLMHGDDLLLSWLMKGKQFHKKIEGHLPGASEKTLARMRLFGVDSDHEAMTADEVERRLLQGYAVTIRYSSIRPDLPSIMKELVTRGHDVFDHLMMTTDGSTPSFHLDGVMDKCIRDSIAAGVQPIDAYQMAAYNVARYYNMTNLHGMVATGRYATINVLEDELSPTPISVLSKGVWLKRDGQKVQAIEGPSFKDFEQFTIPLELTDDDFQFSTPIGIEMLNDVITKPYTIASSFDQTEIEKGLDESFLAVIDRKGKWRINTIVKGFDTHIEGFASSYSNAGDIILIGKSIEAMKLAFEKVKEMNGGVVIVENGETIAHIHLPVGGFISNIPVEEIIEQEVHLKEAVRERGYRHSDVIYTLLFLQSTHLPYIRITQVGLVDVLKNQIMIPTVMR
jgi:adenine deaminase